jgi:hypothetical protein
MVCIVPNATDIMIYVLSSQEKTYTEITNKILSVEMYVYER